MSTFLELAAATGSERIEIRPAAADDIDACVALQLGVAGTPEHGRVVAAMRRALRQADRWLWVAACAHRVAGFARLSRIDQPATVDAPSGFYLGGVTVEPALRRRGIGLALTRERLALAFAAFDADRVWYFANAGNASSIALHAKLGFVEMRRPFEFPQVTFEGGVGALFALQRDTWESRAVHATL